MRKSTLTILALIVAALAAWMWFHHAGAVRAAKARASAAPPPVPVTAGVAAARDMPIFVRGIGTVQAYNTVTVKSRADGQIVKVGFTEGQEVKAGDLLFEIDPRPLQAALMQAVANQEKDQALAVSAQGDLSRFAQLLASGVQTQQSYDQQKAVVGQLQASIKADQAQIDTARLNLQYTEIRSPIDGRTGARLVDAGNLVHATDNTALVTITQLRPIFVSFTVPQNQLDAIRTSARAGPLEVRALTASDERPIATGRLTLIDNQIDPATGTLRLKGTFDNGDTALWPGEFVNARVVTGTAKDAVTVPARAVQRGPNGNYLFVIKDDMTVDMRSVDVAQVEQEVAVIGRGLAVGERIVIDGQYRLEQGTRVALPAPGSK